MELETNVALAIDAIQKLLTSLKAAPGVDTRSLAVARTHFETGFLWVANAASGEAILDGI